MPERLETDRVAHRETFRSAGKSPYPTWHGRTHAAAEIRGRYPELQGKRVTVAGRLWTTRQHGGLAFLDLRDASGRLQLLCRRDTLGTPGFSLLAALDPGDLIAASGPVIRTEAGEPSVDVREWTLLAKALAPLPEKRAGLKDTEERARRREVDLLANEETRKVFAVRAQVIRFLREFLTRQGFTEVETPILQPLAGGAAARPFRTHHEALKLDLALRIAPELSLKRLIVGGYEKVFELGRVFRNEGMDRQHNPEFTACELYQAYATVEDLLPLTERLFSELFTILHGSPTITFQGTRLNFAPPWPRISLVAAVREATDVDVRAERTPAVYLKALRRLKITPPEDKSLPSLMDELFTETVRRKTAGPAFFLGSPVELEPLAKRDPRDPRIVQSALLVVAGMELAKAYTEENDPAEQEERFQEQARLRQGSGGASPAAEVEIHPLDAAYLEALKVGLPPTAGWGLGVDRLVMLAADRPSIRDVLYFPLLRPRKGRR